MAGRVCKGRNGIVLPEDRLPNRLIELEVVWLSTCNTPKRLGEAPPDFPFGPTSHRSDIVHLSLCASTRFQGIESCLAERELRPTGLGSCVERERVDLADVVALSIHEYIPSRCKVAWPDSEMSSRMRKPEGLEWSCVLVCIDR